MTLLIWKVALVVMTALMGLMVLWFAAYLWLEFWATRKIRKEQEDATLRRLEEMRLRVHNMRVCNEVSVPKPWLKHQHVAKRNHGGNAHQRRVAARKAQALEA